MFHLGLTTAEASAEVEMARNFVPSISFSPPEIFHSIQNQNQNQIYHLRLQMSLVATHRNVESVIKFFVPLLTYPPILLPKCFHLALTTCSLDSGGCRRHHARLLLSYSVTWISLARQLSLPNSLLFLFPGSSSLMRLTCSLHWGMCGD